MRPRARASLKASVFLSGMVTGALVILHILGVV